MGGFAYAAPVGGYPLMTRSQPEELPDLPPGIMPPEPEVLPLGVKGAMAGAMRPRVAPMPNDIYAGILGAQNNLTSDFSGAPLNTPVPPAESGTPAKDEVDAAKSDAAIAGGQAAGRSTQHVPTLRENWSLPTGTASVNRGKGLGGDAWLASQTPMPRGMDLDVSDSGAVRGSPVPRGELLTRGTRSEASPHEGVLFSGTGTQADEEGRLRAEGLLGTKAKLRAEKATAEELTEDPFARERTKAGADIQRDVIREGARGKADIDTAQAKDDAKYASGDTILLIMYQSALAKLEAETQRPPEEKERIKAGLFKKYQKDRLELRKQGLTGGYEKKDFFSDLPTTKPAADQ